MAIVTTDWTVSRSTGDIRYIGNDHGGASPSYATVIQFHRWLQDLADDASSSGDDELDITDENPSARSTDNIIKLLGNYNIDNASIEHLYDGTIVQGSGGTEKVWDGIVNFGNSDVQIQIIQNGAVIADDWWNYNGGGLNPDPAQGISHRFMLLVRDSGADIDGRRVLGTCRRFGYTYSEFPINGTSRGNNVLALSDSSDLNNSTAEATVATWTTITNVTEGFASIDVDNDGSTEDYYSEWNKDSYTINQFYERMKWLTREGSASTFYGLNGELFRGITHETDVDTPTGTFNAFEAISWATGTGQMLAIDSTTAGTKLWMQLLTGTPPVDGQVITGGTSSATVTVNVTVTERTISVPFVGASTGSALIGSYGLGLEATDLTAADKVFDLTNTQKTPPNYVTFTVGGLDISSVGEEDVVLVGPWDAVSVDAEGNPAINTNQMAINTSLTTDNITSVVIGHANGDVATIPTDTPSTGTIRVVDDSGFSRQLHYSSWTGSTFTIDTTNGQEDFAAVNATAGNDCWISYIDTVADASSEAFTSVFNTSRDLVVRVRNGHTEDSYTPIKEFITSAVLGSNGGSVTAIRTSDT